MRECRHHVPELGRDLSVFVNTGELDAYRSRFDSAFPVPTTLRYLLGIPPPERFVDFGASIGGVAFFVAALGAKVLAVEALAENFILLAEGVLANGFTDVVPCHVAAGDRSQVLSFAGTSAWGHVPRAPGAVGSERVPALAGDDILELHGFTAADLIKIAVEGHELEVLAGLTRTLDRSRPVLVLESNTWAYPEFGENERALQLLRGHGYSLFMYVDDVVRADEDPGIQEFCVADYLCVPREKLGRVAMPSRKEFAPEERVALLARDLVVPSPHWWHAAHAIDRFEERFPAVPGLDALKDRIANEPAAVRLILERTATPPRWMTSGRGWGVSAVAAATS